MKYSKRFIFLAKLGIIESTNEKGVCEIQRIDNPEDFQISNELTFLPPLLESDEEAKELFKSLTHSRLESLEIEISVDDIHNSVIDKINSLDLRSDLENGNIKGCILKCEGYVGNRPSDCEDEEHEDDTWAIDLIENDSIEKGYLYSSKYEYEEDVKLLKEFA